MSLTNCSTSSTRPRTMPKVAADIRVEAEKLLRLVQQIDSTIEEAAAVARRIGDGAQKAYPDQLKRLMIAGSVEGQANSLANLIVATDGTYVSGLAAEEARDLLDLIDLGRTERGDDA